MAGLAPLVRDSATSRRRDVEIVSRRRAVVTSRLPAEAGMELVA